MNPQGAHTLPVAFTVELLVPAGQGVQDDDPINEYDPAVQPTQEADEFAPTTEFAVPAGHNEQDATFPKEKDL